MRKRMKKRMRSLLCGGLLLVLLGSAASLPKLLAKADLNVSYQDDIDAAKKKKEELEKNRKEIESAVAALKSQQADMTAYIASLDLRCMELTEDVEQLEGDIADCEERLEETRQNLAEAKEREESQYDTMKRRIRYMYENGEGSFLDVFLGGGSLSEIFNELEYRAEITKYDNALLERYNAAKLQVMQTEELLLAQLDELESLKETREYELAAVNELMEAKANELIALAESIGIEEDQLSAYAAQISEAEENIEELELLEEERLAELERIRKEEEERLRREAEERARKEAEAAELRRNQDIENMLWPLPVSGRITSPFGARSSPTAGASTYHKGIDIGAPIGSDVLAALAGRVIEATYNYSSGYYIKIDHGNGLVTVYMHSSKLLVKAGDYVERGQVIMKVGSTGISTGPHLHFGILINGTAVDPRKYVSYN